MRFSVIVPLYNKASYIKKALDSVMEQTFKDYELIVVDDGSTDNSLCIAQDALEKTGLNFQLIHQENAGVSTARNNGVAVSHGDFLCFLDADDWWAPTFLERIDWLIREYPDAGIYGTNYYYVKNNKKRVCVSSTETGYIDYCRVYYEQFAMPLTSISVAINRTVFNEFGGFRPTLKLGEDFDLWIRIALKYKVAFLNEALAFYFQDSDPEWRGIRQMQEPKYHMLWNLDYLIEEEKSNTDYRRLIDRLRTYSLLPYYLTKKYRKAAKAELNKVDWSRQSKKTRILYSLPIPILKCRMALLKVGSRIKQTLVKHL